MRRIDQGLVRESQKFVVQRIVKERTEFARCPTERSSQVGTADIADEERITGEDRVRFGVVFLKVEDQD